MNRRKVVIVTIGQPSTNPRMVKEVEALTAAGIQVKVFYSYWVSWGQVADAVFIKKHPGVFEEIGGNPYTAKRVYFISRLIHKIVRFICPVIPFLRKNALARTTLALRKAAIKEPADLYIAHNLGALPAAAAAAKKNNASLGFDAEDYHRGQYEESDPHFRIACLIEDAFIPHCDYITAASPLITRAYKGLFPAKNIITVNNVFSKKHLQLLPPGNENELTLFWFSQTVGADRGLETVVLAINQLNHCAISLCLLGDCSATYREQLLRLAVNPAAIRFIQPVQSEEIFTIGAQFDVGLSTEVHHCANRDFCLTNKLFTYLLSGNCIVASDTNAQKLFLSEHPGIGLLYRHGDPNDLAVQLEKLYNNSDYLQNCRQSALDLATSTCNWENESKTLLSVIEEVLLINYSKREAVIAV